MAKQVKTAQKEDPNPLLQPGNLMRAVKDWAKSKRHGEQLVKEADKFKKEVLVGFVQRYGDLDAEGHQWVMLDETIALPGMKKFNSIKLERHAGESPDEDIAFEIAEDKGLTENLFDWVPVLNIEKLDEQVAEGNISWEERQEIMKSWERFHFVVALKE